MKKLVCFLALTPVCAFAQTLSTLGPNNGTGGVFFDLTPTTNNLTFNSFATYFGSTTLGTPASIQVWVRSGSYVGFTTANTGWTLYETVVGTAAGTGTLSAPIAFTTPISLTAGSTTGFYIHSITTGNGLRYQGTGSSSTSNFSNSDLALFSNIARTGNVAFGGSQFTPRAFSGDINYTVSSVPEPASMAALGLGVAALLRRKKKAAK